MNNNERHVHRGPSFLVLALVTILIFTVSGVSNLLVVEGSSPLDLVGYLDFSYGPNVPGEVTGEKPESKLWWNDGFWWGSLFNQTDQQYHIYRLDWGAQNWDDTGITLDDRPNSRADVLWDDAHQQLYVASHVFSVISSKVIDPNNWGRLYKFSYDKATQSYTQDIGFPVAINKDKTETLVMDKDQDGRLWVAYVSRDPSIPPGTDAQVYVNATTTIGNDAVWGTPISLGDQFPGAHVSQDDIASIIAFGDKIGVMWSNQLIGDGKYYFAVHDITQAPGAGWTLEVIDHTISPYFANDHINLAKDNAGNVFAAIKTSVSPLIALLARDTTLGTFSYHEISDLNTNDTRPIVVVNESENKLYVFNTSRTSGGRICYREATIVSPLSGINFSPNDCRNTGLPSPTDAPLFIADNNFDNINNPTSFKQLANNTTGLVVLGSDDLNGQIYVHNAMGNPPPVVTQRFPAINAIDVLPSSIINATFSKTMKASTLSTSSFRLEDPNGLVSGSVAYNSTSRTASFTPSTSLKAETVYTATLTSDVQGSDSQPLFGAPETWKFATELPKVMFDKGSYDIAENGINVVITVKLSAPSSHTVSVQYATLDGTAIAGTNYTSTSGTLTFNPGQTTKTFQVPIIDNAIPDGNKTFDILLSSASHATLGTPATAVVTIIDNDIVLVQFSPASITVNENAGSAHINVILTLASPKVVTVDYATSNGTAQAPGDFTAQTGTLTFNPGETTKSFDIPIVDDLLYEADETVLLALSNPTNANLGTPDELGTLTILNNDLAPNVQLSSDSYQVSENVGSAVITLTLSSPSGLPTDVQFSASDGTAQAGTDFTAVDSIVTFNPGETTKTISVPILNDLLSEPTKSVLLKLSNPTNAALGSPIDGTLLILDDDPLPIVQFSQAEFTGIESSETVTITVSLNTASGQTVSIDYFTTDGTAKAGLDYTAVTNTLEFLPGETEKTFTIQIVKDSLPEFREAFKVTLTNPDEILLGTPIEANIVIEDGTLLIFLPLVSK